MSEINTAPAAPLDEDEQSRRFEAYKAARIRAEETLDWRDGLAAGKAWARFLDAFLSPETAQHLTRS